MHGMTKSVDGNMQLLKSLQMVSQPQYLHLFFVCIVLINQNSSCQKKRDMADCSSIDQSKTTSTGMNPLKWVIEECVHIPISNRRGIII